MGGVSLEKTRHGEFADCERRQADVEPALHPLQTDGILQLPPQERHGNTLPARLMTGFGYTPRNTLANAVSTRGMTIQGTSTIRSCAESGASSKYALYTMGPRYAALSSELASSTPSSDVLPRSTEPSVRYHLETNPDAGGRPTRLREATEKAAMVHGICLASPDIWLISVLCVDT